MRVPKTWIPVLAKEVIEELLSNDAVELHMPEEQVSQALAELILEELMIEDRLNDEVREMLREYDSEIEKGRLDYRRLFEMTKQKLVRERDIVL